MKIEFINSYNEKEKIKKFIDSFQEIDSAFLPKNFSTDKSNKGNIVNILNDENGRFYQKNAGFVIVYTELNKFVACGGYFPFILDKKIGSILLSRFFIRKEWRANKINITDDYFVSTILEKKPILGNWLWMTFNKDREILYNAFLRQDQKKSPILNSSIWPSFFTKFYCIGQREIFNTTQYVVESKNFLNI